MTASILQDADSSLCLAPLVSVDAASGGTALYTVWGDWPADSDPADDIRVGQKSPRGDALVGQATFCLRRAA